MWNKNSYKREFNSRGLDWSPIKMKEKVSWTVSSDFKMTLKDDEASGAVTVHEDATTEEEDANNGDGVRP